MEKFPRTRRRAAANVCALLLLSALALPCEGLPGLTSASDLNRRYQSFQPLAPYQPARKGRYRRDSINIGTVAFAQCSSDTPSTMQMCFKAIDGVIDGYPGDYTKEWASAGGGAGSWIQLGWSESYTVNSVTLYDRPNLNDWITSGHLTFSDGSSVTVGPLSNDGSGNTISFSPRTINSVQFTIDSVGPSTLNIGLAEFQVYASVSSSPINVASYANVIGLSSQDASTGQTGSKAIDGVISGYPNNYSAEWATIGGGVGSYIELGWDAPQTVSSVSLYDRPNLNDQITSGTLLFSDGSSVLFGSLNNDGSQTSISFSSRAIDAIMMVVGSVSPSTQNVGLSEFQVWGVQTAATGTQCLNYVSIGTPCTLPPFTGDCCPSGAVCYNEVCQLECTTNTMEIYCDNSNPCDSSLGYVCTNNKCSPPPGAIHVGTGQACDQQTTATRFCQPAQAMCINSVCTPCLGPFA